MLTRCDWSRARPQGLSLSEESVPANWNVASSSGSIPSWALPWPAAHPRCLHRFSVGSAPTRRCPLAEVTPCLRPPFACAAYLAKEPTPLRRLEQSRRMASRAALANVPTHRPLMRLRALPCSSSRPLQRPSGVPILLSLQAAPSASPPMRFLLADRLRVLQLPSGSFPRPVLYRPFNRRSPLGVSPTSTEADMSRTPRGLCSGRVRARLTCKQVSWVDTLLGLTTSAASASGPGAGSSPASRGSASAHDLSPGVSAIARVHTLCGSSASSRPAARPAALASGRPPWCF
jgi:hypothetical protein